MTNVCDDFHFPEGRRKQEHRKEDAARLGTQQEIESAMIREWTWPCPCPRLILRNARAFLACAKARYCANSEESLDGRRWRRGAASSVVASRFSRPPHPWPRKHRSDCANECNNGSHKQELSSRTITSCRDSCVILPSMYAHVEPLSLPWFIYPALFLASARLV